MPLEPELIPEPLWNISAAHLLGRKSKAWRDIRAAALQAADNTCSACGEMTPGGKFMVCDELWSYDEQQATVMLTGVRILCPACDHARHFARAAQLGQGVQALETLARVNGVSVKRAQEMQAAASAMFTRRSRLTWTVRVDAALLAANPVLAALEGQRGAPGDGRAKVAAADRAHS